MENISIISKIDNDKLNEAFSDTDFFFDACREFNDNMTLLSARHKKISFDERLGTVGSADLSVELNRIRYNFRKIVGEFQRNVIEKYFDVGHFHDEIEELEDQDKLMLKIMKYRLEPMGYMIPDIGNAKGEKNNTGVIRGKNSLFIPIKKTGSYLDATSQVLYKTSLNTQEKNDFKNLLEIKHRNIVKVLDVEVKLYPFFLISEYIYGDTLDKVILKTGRRPVSQVIDWLYQLADALLYLNQKNIHHFNVRPSKIHIDDEFHVMISPIDLFGSGMGKTGARVEISNFWDVCRYGSPELLKEYSPDKRSNSNTRFVCASEQFSLGLIAYYALTGEELFSGNSVLEILDNRKQFERDPESKLKNIETLPKLNIEGQNLVDIVRKLLKVNPNERYSSLHALIRDIHRLSHAEFEDAVAVQKSYRRALANNRELIREFYKNLIADKNLKMAEMFSKINEDKKMMSRLYSMLQMSIDIIINLDEPEYRNKFNSLFFGKNRNAGQNNPHEGLKDKDYNDFLVKLIETISQSDPEYQKDKNLRDAWEDTKINFLELWKIQNSQVNKS